MLRTLGCSIFSVDYFEFQELPESTTYGCKFCEVGKGFTATITACDFCLVGKYQHEFAAPSVNNPLILAKLCSS